MSGDAIVMGTRWEWEASIREIVPPKRMVLTEKFDDAWYPGEALVTHVLEEKAGKTIYTYTMLFESREARDVTLKSGMEKGVIVSYARLDDLLASLGK